MFTRIYLKNYRSFDEFELNLVGKNMRHFQAELVALNIGFGHYL